MAILPTSALLRSIAEEKGDKLFSVLYANSQPRLGSYIALAKAIEDAGHLAVVISPTVVQFAPDELTGFESVVILQMTGADIKCLSGVDLFFASEIVSDVIPDGAVTICIFHSIPDAGLKADRLTSNAARFVEMNPVVIRTFDYLVAAVCQHKIHWNVENYSFIQNLYPAPFLKDRRKMLDIIPGGYPKLDYSRRILASTEVPDSIIYSPTAHHASQGNVRRDGETILFSLLAEFSNMRIVFRPYPNPSDVQYGREIAKKFASNPKFVFDDSATGISNQKRCAVAITDSSSSAITFSLATSRPLVFVDISANSDAKAEKNPFGFKVKTIKSMLEVVRSAIENAEVWKESISREAQKNIYNPGEAAAYLASNLELFASRLSHTDWLSVERKPWIPNGAEGEIGHLMDRLRTWCDRVPSTPVTKMYSEIRDHLLNKPYQGIDEASCGKII